MATQLTDHFTLEELCVSDYARRYGLDNTPKDAAALAALHRTARGLETVRAICGGYPVMISSGYRSFEVNSGVGGVAGSDHTLGFAADFVIPLFGSPYEVCAAILASGWAKPPEGGAFPFDQLIHEKRRWVHISFHPRARGQVLTLPPGKGARYIVGLRE